MAVVSPKLDEVWLVSLDPAEGAEIQKTRPCMIVSPDELNQLLQTVIVAPMTTTLHLYPSRAPIVFMGKKGQVALDQLRSVDRRRLVRRLGMAPEKAAQAVSKILLEMFTRKR